MSERVPQVLFVFSLCLASLFYGIAAAKLRLFPYETLMTGYQGIRDWRENWKHYSRLRPDKFIAPNRFGDSGLIVNTPGEVSDGVTLVTGFFGGNVGMELLSIDGKVLHTWTVSFNELFPDYTERTGEKVDDWDISINGALLYPNGDVIVNFYRTGIARLDYGARPVWTSLLRGHHAVAEDVDGSLWIPGVRRGSVRYRIASGTAVVDDPECVYRISPEGTLLDSFDVLTSIVKSGWKGILAGYLKRRMVITGDWLSHLNDVEVVPENVDAPPGTLQPGDLVLSLLGLNALIGVDRKTKEVKWAQTGPFVGQHDPDFLANGDLIILDNQGGGRSDVFECRSRVVETDLFGRLVAVRYLGTERHPFYTKEQGALQPLPNGDILVTESRKGNIVEVDPQGRVVWQYVVPWDENEVVIVYQATRYPTSYGSFAQGDNQEEAP